MTDQPAQVRPIPWRTFVLLAVAIGMAGVTWWTRSRQPDTREDAMVICIKCSRESTVKVGDTPGDEVWPRTCTACGQKSLYMGVPCRACGKTMALKDPQADRFGRPTSCPHCKDAGTRGS